MTPVDAPPELHDYIEEVGRSIQSQFGRDVAEAAARIAAFWPRRVLWEEGLARMVFLRLPDEWAKRICYEEDATYWRKEFVRKIRPYPAATRTDDLGSDPSVIKSPSVHRSLVMSSINT